MAGRAVSQGATLDARSSGLGTGVRRAVALSTVAKAGELVTLALLATLVPRRLGPVAFGELSVALTLVTLGSLALTLGGPAVMARFVPAAVPAERVAIARALGARLARGRAVQVALVGGGLVVLAVAAPDLLDAGDTALIFAAFALNVATSVALQVPLGLGATVPWALRYPAQNAVLIVSVVALYPVAGVTGALVGLVLASAAGAAYAAVVLARTARGDGRRVALPRGALRFGVVVAAAAVLTQCVQRGGVVAVQVLAEREREVGYAALAIGVALGLTYAVVQAFTVALPHLSAQVVATGSSAASEATLRLLAVVLLVPLVAAGVVAGWTAAAVVPAVFGQDYAGAVDAFGPALAMVVLAPVVALGMQAAALHLRPQVTLAGAGIGAVVFVAVALAAIPPWGATGATAAALAGTSAAAAVTTWALRTSAGTLVPVATLVGVAAVLAAFLA